MPSPVLDERIAREAARVAACFGVEAWGIRPYITDAGSFHCLWGDWACGDDFVTFRAKFTEDAELFFIEIDGPGLNLIELSKSSLGTQWKLGLYDDGPPLDFELMARGLYRLGFSDESVLAQLPPLSAHEKLECRMSLAREYWPQSWLEEGQNVTEYQSQA